MSVVPIIGTYSALDETIQIQITSANPSNGQIQGTYTDNFTPEGKIIVTGNIGGYAWVKDTNGECGQAPFHINFTIYKSPNDLSYTLVDFWNGYYTKNNTIIISGVRSYVTTTGTKEAKSLGTLTLTISS